MNYESNRVLNQVEQVLNYSYNWYEDYKNIDEILDIYNKILSSYSNEAFKASMKNSKKALNSPELVKRELNNLMKNNTNSFLIVALCAKNHLFSCVIRKTSEGFSVTLVNKAANIAHQEYVFKHVNSNEIMDLINSCIYTNNVAEIYKMFENNCEHVYDLNIKSGKQKTGNCFIKEIEAGIKFAYATRKFSSKEFQNLRKNDLEKVKLKWGKHTTTDIHKMYVKELITLYPKEETTLNKLLNLYVSNKNFRNYLKCGIDIKTSLTKAFKSNKYFEEKGKDLLIKELLKNVDYYSFKSNINRIEDVVLSLKDENLKNAYNILVKNGILLTLMGNCNENEICSLDVINAFPVVVKHLYEVNGFSYSAKGIELASEGNYEEAVSTSKKGVFLQPNAPFTYFLYANVLAKQNLFEDAIKSYTQAIELAPHFGLAYYERSSIHLKLGKLDKAKEDFKLAVKHFPRFKYSKLKENIITEYFNREKTFMNSKKINEVILCYKNILDIDSENFYAKGKLKTLKEIDYSLKTQEAKVRNIGF